MAKLPAGGMLSLTSSTVGGTGFFLASSATKRAALSKAWPSTGMRAGERARTVGSRAATSSVKGIST